MTEEDVDAVRKIVEHTGGVEEARKLAASYTEKALKEIKKLPATSSNKRESLFPYPTDFGSQRLNRERFDT